MIERTAGLLLHPTSLPGPFGIGDLGPMAYRWVDTLAAMKQSWWQILPLGPTGFGDSPYQSYSAFAGSVLLLSPEKLIEFGLLPKDFAPPHAFDPHRVDFDLVTPFKLAMLRQAWEQFRAGHSIVPQSEFDAYCQREAGWLDDYALFMSIRTELSGSSLGIWPKELRTRQPEALAAMEQKLAAEILQQKFGQFLFDQQWTRLREYAASKQIRLIGDIPIFVSADSADVWANPSQFLLDEDGHPTVVAGVPPDYFSEDGQHWGNPLYNWPAMAADGYRWWIARVRAALRQVDLIRFDHFRGFVQAWNIPAGETTARNGAWVDGPGRVLFDAISSAVGGLPLLAEDLGLITPDVIALRQELGLPGMRVLQFMLGEPDNFYQPHNYDPNTACYTGTHDNDTSAGWYALLSDKERYELAEYVGHKVTNPARELIRMAWGSVAALAIAPLQDVFALGSEARMNVPGQPSGNWQWRFRSEQFNAEIIKWMAQITARYARVMEPADSQLP